MKLMAKICLLSLVVTNSLFAQFSNESELSILTTGGNTELKTYNGKTKNLYKADMNTYTLSGGYVYGESSAVRSAENWNILLRYDRTLTERLSLFISELAESNRFSGFSRRFNTDIGFKYIFHKTDRNTSFAELGYRYTIEKKANKSLPDSNDSKIRLYLETMHKFSETTSGKLWLEYLPNLSESKDTLLTTEASLAMALDKTFSVKLAYKWIMDNLPEAGNSKYDYQYTTALLANF